MRDRDGRAGVIGCEGVIPLASIGSRVHGAKLAYVPMDLADPASLEASVIALGLDRLDAVVHNAGVALDHPPDWGENPHDGLRYAVPSLRQWLWTWADGGDVWDEVLKIL
ncbi:hypothetical protein [Kitasatospora griseola]|uniref:hypothetical protein n=1 Tax=Kitasatospora griseola TaxID=2064 RepID=UPI00381E0576